MRTLLTLAFIGILQAQAPLPTFSGSGGGGGGGGATPAGSAVTDAQCWASSSTFGVCTSPAFTSPTVTTQSANDNSTKAASTAYADRIALAAKVNSVNLNGSGGFTCNFSLGYICLVNQNGDGTNPLVATVSNLPTNQIVWFVFSINGVRGITWPSNVLCNLGDAFSQCPTVNGFTSGSGKWPFAFWSDATSLYASGDSGYLQTVRAAHVDVGTLQLVGTLPADFASTPGSIQLLFGSQIHNNPNCASSASPADCTSFNTPVGSVVIAAGATSVIVDTSAVGANSQIFVQPDSGLGAKLSVTCNAAAPTGMVITRSAGTSFTITVGVAPVTNPFCFSYFIMN